MRNSHNLRIPGNIGRSEHGEYEPEHGSDIGKGKGHCCSSAFKDIVIELDNSVHAIDN